MTAIRVGFSTHPNSLVSWFIRKVTRSEASHAWLLIEHPLFGAHQLVFEAVGAGGFRMVTLDAFKRDGNKIIALADPLQPLDKGMDDAVKWLGHPYDHGAFFGYAWVLLGRAFRRSWRNPFHGSKALFCSEAVCRVLRAAHYPGALRLDPDGVTPQDLMDLFAAQGRLMLVKAEK